ncbi:hypothetical protein [Streptomyces sp. MJM1172]|uniref:hypothetical protein n=1 Tax=Streptomyces sp. MJM1172 TaxID=1703926 RepID=UPI00093D9ADC|nr:hypothetical protein [Streptomyces sp. MJM1172]OKI71394.1 hypothetical protein AMK15_01840 [Streptomyces sp. MJM1172]
MSLEEAYTNYLNAKVETGYTIDGLHLEPVPWRTVTPSYRLHLGDDGNGYPLYLGVEAEAIHQLNSGADKLREVAAIMAARKRTRLERFLSRI